MTAEILRPRRLAWNRSGANLVSGVASTLLASRDAELGLPEVDEAVLPEVVRRVRPRAVLLGNLFRDQLDRYGELELIAERWRAAAENLPASAVLIVNGDDPQVGELARERDGALAFGIDDPEHARPALQHAADSRYCVVCGSHASSRPRTSATSATTAAPPAAMRARRCRCGRGRSSCAGSTASRSSWRRLRAGHRVQLPLPGLYNVYNALGAAALAHALGATPAAIQIGWSASAPRSGASSASRPATRAFSSF